jgi:SAM-dependent methyltransferase
MTEKSVDNTGMHRGWDYVEHGDYHRNPDPNWSYTPTYLRKMSHVRRYLAGLSPDLRIVDAGCGEGLLVEEFRAKGYRIDGIDLNYESEFVTHGDILSMPYEDASVDLVLLLDVFEHLQFADQPVALQEMARILRPNGRMLLVIPNLAHLNARFRMFFGGRLDRSDIDINHCGERPLQENLQLLREAGFEIGRLKGITLTVPWLYRRVICRRPARYRWLHDALEVMALPSLAMFTFIECRRTGQSRAA